MTDVKRIEGEIVYEQDSKRFFRYQVLGSGIVGTVYLPKDQDVAQKYKLILEPVKEEGV